MDHEYPSFPEGQYAQKKDQAIQEDIRKELWWSPFVDAGDVNIFVDDGVVTLTGTVDSWMEYRAAQENASEGGAVWVDNNLQVSGAAE